MLDIQFIRENADTVKQKAAQKGYDVDIDQLLGFDKERRELQVQVDDLRRQSNELAAAAKGQRPSEEQIAKGRELKDQTADLEHRLSAVDKEFDALLKSVPNLPLDEVPVGASEQENVVVREVGDKPSFDFEAKPHWAILEPRDLVDKERAAKIAGSRFTYLKGPLVKLQFAVLQFAMDRLGDEGYVKKLIEDNGLNLSTKPFTPILPPAVLRTEPYVASARLNAEEMTYKLEGDDLWLNASAEHTLCTMYWNEILPEEQLPIRYMGYSTSFRREAGTYGKDTEGIIRLHQFDKLEMEVFSTAETGPEEHKLALAIQESLVAELGLPYRVLQKCTFDIGKPNASGWDIEVWFPGQTRYIETHTADFLTDYQARDLKIRTKRGDKVELVHTNDATAFAMSRILAAIAENYQTADGHIRVPEALKGYLGGAEQL